MSIYDMYFFSLGVPNLMNIILLENFIYFLIYEI